MEQKPFLNLERMNRETYEILSTKLLRSQPVVNKMLNSVSQDSKIIGML